MKKRLFIALPISQNLQNEILKWQEKYACLPVRWLSGKNLHITLIPPWYEEDINGVREKLNKIREIGGIELNFQKVTFGPNSKNPHLIWAEGKAPQKLLDLINTLENIFGLKKNNRTFLLHLTLARFKSEDLDSFPIKEINEIVSWKDVANSLVLMESIPFPSGSDYEILEEIKF